MLTPRPEDEEDWLRTNIFHTSCTIKDKVCKVIVDSGSCENVISQRSHHQTELANRKAPIDSICLIYLSIDKKYFDKVWCDVVTMDACHMLLGKPWQYNRHSMHDGRNTAYTFQKDDKKITLALMRETELPKPKSQKGIGLLTLKPFMEAIETGMVLVVIEQKGLVDVIVLEQV